MNIKEKMKHIKDVHIFAALLHPSYKEKVDEWRPEEYNKRQVIGSSLKKCSPNYYRS